MNIQVWTQFIRWLFTNKDIIPRQVTLSLDNLNTKEINEFDMIKIETFASCLYYKSQSNNDTEFHITAHNFKTLESYISNSLYSLPDILDWLRNIDLISISTPCDIRNAPYTYMHRIHRWNLNYSPSQSNLFDMRSIVRWLESPLCESVYVILEKNGHSHPQPKENIRAYKKALQQLDLFLSPEQKEKIVVDSCVKDSYSFVTTGRGCGANIHKLHVWPDGHITGCPYNRDGGPTANSLGEVVNNVYSAIERYDFSECTIPSSYYLQAKSSTTLKVVQ